MKIGVMTGVYWILDCWDNLVKNTMWVGMQIQNICGDMKAGTLKIIENMCNGAIDIINKFIAALNYIPGVSIEFLEHVTFGTTAQLENDHEKAVREAKYSDYENELARASENRWNEIEAWKAMAESEYWAREAEIKAAQDEVARTETYGNEDAVQKYLCDTADNTKDIKDSLDITQEDLRYLRDLAEQEVINRFTTAEIKIDMTNHNSINSEMDIDGIVDHLETRLHEVMVSTAEGVH